MEQLCSQAAAFSVPRRRRQTIFYQSELPYDPPGQAAWMDGTANGYPSYVVSNAVSTHQAYGLGISSFFNQGVNIIEDMRWWFRLSPVSSYTMPERCS